MFSETRAQPPAEYVTDVSYERTFVHQLTPATLRLVAAINGVTPPPEDDFDYLELGAANGDTLVALAAANPRARFVGVDLNARHVAFGNDLAQRAGVGNVRFLERDFEDLAKDDLPAFDFVSAHGVLSWVAPAKRRAVLELARSKLKPGGLFYVSYNALPGWSAIEPLRRLMLDFSASVPGTTLDRAREGLDFVQRLEAAGAAYVTSHPTARSMLALMKKAGLPYVVHEYFHAHWHPMYFADLARDMAAQGLAFVGQQPLANNVRELALPPALKDIAKTAPDRIAYETLKDFAVNEFLRSDVFVKGSGAYAEAAMRAYFEGTAFGTTASLPHIKRSVKLPVYSLDFTGPVYDAILREITLGAAAASELAARPTLTEIGVTRLGDCLQNLALGGQVVPMRRMSTSAGSATSGDRHEVPLAYNRVVLDDVLSAGGGPSVLASTTIGAGVPITLLEAMCLHLLTSVEPPSRAAWLRKFSHRKTPRLTIGDRAIDNADELARIVTRELKVFMVKAIPKCIELGLVAPAP